MLYSSGSYISLLMIFQLFCQSIKVEAVICHATVNPENFQVHPCDSVVGKWGGSASCVAISSNFVLTTRHQGGGVGTKVLIADGVYTVDKCFEHPNVNGEVVDLRIARLSNAHLISYVRVADINLEVSVGTEVYIGGYGRVRGVDCYSGNNIYGYTWHEPDSDVLNWCTNVVDAIFDCGETKIIIADFDGPDPVIDGQATEFEGIIAENDSGGGWFVNTDGFWQLLGISYAVQRSGEARFRSPTPDVVKASPDLFYAYDLRRYWMWINSFAVEHSSDIDLSGRVDLLDFSILSSQWLNNSYQVNIISDEIIDINDLQIFAREWLRCSD